MTIIFATSIPAVVAWIVLGSPAAFAITVVAGRLLGARRSWFALSLAGLIGWTGGVVAAGLITGWGWDQLEMILLALLFGTLFTMITALGIDLLAPMGSLAIAEQAGLLNLRNPVKAIREAIRPVRRISRGAPPATAPRAPRRAPRPSRQRSALGAAVALLP
jgi:hypothetical protein